jgi:hypothetical protein
MTAPRTPAAWMILLALSHIKTHAYGVDDLRSIPNPVPGPGHFKQALPGHFWQAPKRLSLSHLPPNKSKR